MSLIMQSSAHRIGSLAAAALLGALCSSCDEGGSVPDPPGTSRAHSDIAEPFKSAPLLPGLLKAKIGGPVRLLDLVIYPDSVLAKVQDPRKKENVDQYEVHRGVVSNPSPARIDRSVAAKLDEQTFDITSVDFAIVPRMAADAVRQFKVDKGKVSYATLSRDHEIHWRFFVSGGRRDGFVDYDTAGRVKKVWER